MDEGDDPIITLGRQQFTVPEFRWRETEKLLPLMRKAAKIDFDSITEADTKLLGDLVWLVASRDKTKSLTREAFDDLPIKMPEIMAAIPVIVAQSGMKAAGSGGTGEPQAAGSA